MRIVAALPACALIAGAALSLASPEPHTFAAFAALIASAAIAIATWTRNRPAWFACAVAALFAAGGFLLGTDAWRRAWRPPLKVAFEQIAEHDEAFAVLDGTLRADASASATGVSLSLEVDRVRGGERPDRDPSTGSGEAMSGGVLLTVGGSAAAERMPEWRAARRVRLPAMLRRPSRYLDPGVPDQERALARRGTILVGFVKSGALVEVLARGSRLDEALATIRVWSRRAIGDAVGRWSARAGAIVLAIVIGDRTGLDADVQRHLQEAGTYHVIAISGGNIAILAGLMLGAFRLAGWLGRSAMLAAIAVLIAYAMLVGGGASVNRATLMAALYFAGRACDQRSPPLNTLAVAAGLLVAGDPLTVADPAFILTFGATLAILVVAPVVAEHAGVSHERRETTKDTKRDHVFVRLVISRLSWLRRCASSPIVSLFAASLAAEAMLFPVGAAVFSRITFAGLVLNFAAIPLMAVAQIAGMAVVPIWFAWRRGTVLAGGIAAAAAEGLVWTAELVRFAPAVAYRVAAPSAVAVAVYYAALATAWWLRGRPIAFAGARTCRRAAIAAAALAAAWMLVDPRGLIARRGDGRLHVTFVDVGQGDATLVRLPGGRALLVDTGGLSSSSTFDIGDRVVAPVIRDARVARLDVLALTHGDPDHIGGAAAILREFRPREVWEGIPVPRLEALTAVRMAAQSDGARWANVYAGDRVSLDGVEVMVHHPRPADWERQKVRNDDSIVIELRWGQVSILLAGDIGKAIERPLAASIAPAALRVLKVPHHGSITSSSREFVAAVHPEVAIVSVGRQNHFGHPSPEVIARYRSAGVDVFRTDEDGAVTLETDGTSVTVRTFNGRQLSLAPDATAKARRREDSNEKGMPRIPIAANRASAVHE